MKKLTVKEVIQALAENMSYEDEHDGGYYYLHITAKGTIVESMHEADESFREKFDYTYDESQVKYLWEIDENAPGHSEFIAAAESLTEQANEWLEENQE